jgi:hypothetical protein
LPVEGKATQEVAKTFFRAPGTAASC